jgi:hypothetical protein
MEMRFDRFAGSGGRLADSAGAVPFDWHGLYARLTAAHDSRRILLAELADVGSANGSFAPQSAQVLAAHSETLASVNRTGLADGKPHSGKATNIAAAQVAGDRGHT